MRSWMAWAAVAAALAAVPGALSAGGEEPEKAAAPAEAQVEKPGEETEKVVPQIRLPLIRSLTIGGQVRLRGEARDVADYRIPGTFGRPAADDAEKSTDFVLQRTRLGLDADVIKEVRALVEIQDSRTWGSEGGLNADTGGVDLYQAFIEIRDFVDEPVTLRGGRMEMPNLGDWRLVGSLDWHNVARSMDGFRASYTPEDWNLQAFVVNTLEAPAVGGDADDDYIFAVFHASYRGVENHEFDAYVMHNHQSDRNFTGETGVLGDQKVATLGARLKGSQGGLGYTAEGALQLGDRAGDDVSAWGAAFTAHYDFECPWKPQLGAELALASGDDNPTDGDYGTFQPPFPFAHKFHGHMDLVGWRNMEAVKVWLKLEPLEEASLHVDFHAFRLNEDADAWYDATGTMLRRDATGLSDGEIGQEIDVYVKFHLWERLHFWVGYSHFFPGDFVTDTGFDSSSDWGFGQVLLKF